MPCFFYPALYTKASMCCIIKYQDNQEQEIVIMKATKVFTMIDDIVKKIQKSDDVTQEDGEKMIGQLTELADIYREVEVHEDQMAVYDALKQKGEWLKSQFSSKKSSDRIKKEINRYIRLLRASLADFRGETGALLRFHRMFVILCLSLLVLSPGMYGPLMSVLLVIPVFGALRGIRDRRMTGIYLSGVIIPLALLTGINWLRAGAGLFSILGAATSVFALVMIYMIYKVKDMFV